MNKIRLCFRVRGGGVDEDGSPCDIGMQVTLGETDKPVDYGKLTQGINKEKLLELVCLNTVFSADDVEVITPEEYDKEYGDEE